MEKRSEGYLNDKAIKAKHKLKDSVFTNLFSRDEYILELYQAVYPKDHDVTGSDISIVTLENIFLNDSYNDLGFLVRDKLLIFVEAQSTWSENILIRVLFYIARTLKEYITEKGFNIYGTKKINIPKIDAYVIYTGERGDKPDCLNLGEEFFQNEKQSVDVNVRIIFEGNQGDIINQYIRFARIYTEQRKRYGRTREAITETIRICKEEDILRKYLTENEKEVMDIMDILFDQGYAVDRYADEIAEKKADERMVLSVSNLMESLKVTADQAMELLKVPEHDRNRYRVIIQQNSHQA